MRPLNPSTHSKKISPVLAAADSTTILSRFFTLSATPSSRGLGHRVFIPVTGVRNPLGSPFPSPAPCVLPEGATNSPCHAPFPWACHLMPSARHVRRLRAGARDSGNEGDDGQLIANTICRRRQPVFRRAGERRFRCRDGPVCSRRSSSSRARHNSWRRLPCSRFGPPTPHPAPK